MHSAVISHFPTQNFYVHYFIIFKPKHHLTWNVCVSFYSNSGKFYASIALLDIKWADIRGEDKSKNNVKTNKKHSSEASLKWPKQQLKYTHIIGKYVSYIDVGRWFQSGRTFSK